MGGIFISYYFDEAQCYYYKKDFEAALKCLDTAVKINHRDFRAYKLKADTLRELQRFEEALTNYNKAIMCFEDKFMLSVYHLYFEKAETFISICNYEEAVNCYELCFKEMNQQGLVDG